jgi:hypothetical protein
MAGITNNNTPPTANTNRDANELTQQKSARAVAFYQNNLELADPLQLQINRPQQLGSSSARSALQYARTTQLSLTLQQQLATLDPAQFRITTNPSVYRPPPTVLPAVLSATGTFTFTGGNLYTFTGSGTFTISGGAAVLDILVVGGGGGGGGSWVGGGGGGGGLVYARNVIVQPSSNVVTVGNGGAGGIFNRRGTTGQNSSFLSFIGYGGGAGGADGGSEKDGGNGGCGGGRSWAGTTVGIGSQGGNGGFPVSGSPIGGGGGGMGGPATSQVGANGLSISITGSAVVYAGGGGAGSDTTGAAGGSGGGGRGGNVYETYNSAWNGGANTGGGGGGGAGGTAQPGGNGGSGIVIIRVVSTDSSTAVQLRDIRPSDITPMNLWLDASDQASLSLSGTNVLTWSDKSGNTRTATGVNNPTYNSATSGILFTPASSQYFTLPDSTFPIGNSSYSYFFIFNPAVTSIMQMITGGDGGGGQRFGIRSGNAGTGTLQTYWIGFDLETSNTYRTGVKNFGATYYTSGGTRSVWVNFTQGASDTPGTRSQTSTKNAIGTLIGLTSEYYSGEMNEVIVCGSLTTAQRQQMEGYLAWKWGLRGNLPIDHPYKAEAPQVPL